jgi:hypothetical protein
MGTIALLVTLAAVHDEPRSEAHATKQETGHSFHELAEAAHAALRAEATASDTAQRREAIDSQIALHREIVGDPRLETSPFLERLRGKIVSRLRRVKRDVQRDLDRSSTSDKQAVAAADRIATIDGGASSVAAQIANAGRAAAAPAAFRPAGGVALVGPNRADNGAELVRLIERTISPAIWDVNGGPATIVYFGPLHVLVVRAPSEVHHSLGPLLGGLRGGR